MNVTPRILWRVAGILSAISFIFSSYQAGKSTLESENSIGLIPKKDVRTPFHHYDFEIESIDIYFQEDLGVYEGLV